MSLAPHDKTMVVITSGTIARALFAVVALLAAYLLWDVILLVLAAIVFASAIEPMTKALVAHRIHRTIAVLFIYMMIVLVLGAVLFFFLPPLIDDISQLTQVFPKLATDPGFLGPFFEKFPHLLETFKQGFSVGEVLPGGADLAAGLGTSVVNTASLLFRGLIGFVLMVVLSFYLSVQEDGIENFLRLVSPGKHESYLVDLWQRSRKKIGLWMQGQLLLGLLIGVFVYLGLSVFGIKYALLLGILAAIFEIIPVFGPIMAAVPGVAVGFTYSLTTGLFILAFYIIIQQFENHLIYPLVVRKIIGIPPLLVILALVVGAEIAGFLGIILAVPLATILVELMSDFEKHKKSLVHPA
ncbi:MAG: hypothetical protein A2542_03040 [Parcubacteria group bacterium RIFOXYD2_FULL_52_8]|nr:MAG: hypothetical protein A2542_03040 [Parcubacteria group bacterium RIFOXYD2_FULL_52_8]